MTRFGSKQEAQSAINAASVPCLSPVWIGPAFANAHGVAVAGWYAVSQISREVRL